MRSAEAPTGGQATQVAEVARKAEESLLSILQRHAEKLNAVGGQDSTPDEKKHAINALKVALAEEFKGIEPKIEHLAMRIEQDERAAAAEGAEEESDEVESIEVEGAGAETADQSVLSFALDCTALEAIHITVAALTTSPLEWGFNLLRLVQLLIADLKRLHKSPVQSHQRVLQPGPVSDAIVADATVRAVRGDAAKSAGPQSEIFTPQFVRDSFPKPFIAQLQRLHDLAYDRFAYSDNAADRKQVSTLPQARYPVSLKSERWPLPCNLQGYKSHALNDELPSENRIKAIQLIGLQQLREQAGHDSNEALCEALDSLWQRIEAGRDGKAEADILTLEELSALEAAATSELESESISECESEFEPSGSEHSILREAWSAVEDWAHEYFPKARRDALIRYAKQSRTAAVDMLHTYLHADFSADFTAAPGEALFAALESLVKTHPIGAHRLAKEAIPVIITEMASNTDVKRHLRGEALLQCAIIAEDYEALKTALLYLNGEEVQVGNIQMPQTLSRKAYRIMYEVLSSQIVFNTKTGPILRQHLLEQYSFSAYQLEVMASGQPNVEVHCKESGLQVMDVCLDNMTILTGLRALYKRSKSKASPPKSDVLIQAKEILEDDCTPNDSALHMQDPFTHARTLKTLLFRVISKISEDQPASFGAVALGQKLLRAAYQGHRFEVELMLYLGAEVNFQDAQGNTALHWSAQCGHIDVAHFLLDTAGAKVCLQNNYSETALLRASEYGQVDIVHALVATGEVDINLRNNEGQSALLKAAKAGHAGVVRVLLDVPGIHINAQDKLGNTALIWAAALGDIDVVRVLLAVEGIDVNIQDREGSTALIEAAKEGYIDIVRALLAVDNISTKTQDRDGNDALSMAMIMGHNDVARILFTNAGTDLELRQNKPSDELLRSSGLKLH